MLILRNPFYVPVVPRIKSRRMAMTRLSLFQMTTARQEQIISLKIYWIVQRIAVS
jgi:hypothetical protein